MFRFREVLLILTALWATFPLAYAQDLNALDSLGEELRRELRWSAEFRPQR